MRFFGTPEILLSVGSDEMKGKEVNDLRIKKTDSLENPAVTQ